MTFTTQNITKPRVVLDIAIAGVSIVIPTYKRVDLCEKLLVSLQRNNQTFFADLEIIVVDNSPPSEALRIEAMSLRYGARYYWKKIGVGAKRRSRGHT